MKIDKNKKVSAIEVKPDRKISELLELMENTGFQGKNLAKSVSVYEKMIKNPDVTILLDMQPLYQLLDNGKLLTGYWKIIILIF